MTLYPIDEYFDGVDMPAVTHDGFLYDGTSLTDWEIVSGTPTVSGGYFLLATAGDELKLDLTTLGLDDEFLPDTGTQTVLFKVRVGSLPQQADLGWFTAKDSGGGTSWRVQVWGPIFVSPSTIYFQAGTSSLLTVKENFVANTDYYFKVVYNVVTGVGTIHEYTGGAWVERGSKTDSSPGTINTLHMTTAYAANFQMDDVQMEDIVDAAYTIDAWQTVDEPHISPVHPTTRNAADRVNVDRYRKFRRLLLYWRTDTPRATSGMDEAYEDDSSVDIYEYYIRSTTRADANNIWIEMKRVLRAQLSSTYYLQYEFPDPEYVRGRGEREITGTIRAHLAGKTREAVA